MQNTNEDYKKGKKSDDISDYTLSHNNVNNSEASSQTEIIKDKDGEVKKVVRTKIKDENISLEEVPIDKNIASKPSQASEESGKQMAENRDKNSDIARNRTT